MSIAADRTAPATSISLAVDKPGKLSLASLRGKVVVMNFWQSYCGPCHAEATLARAALKQWSGKDVVFLGVDEQDLRGPAQQVHEALRHHLSR